MSASETATTDLAALLDQLDGLIDEIVTNAEVYDPELGQQAAWLLAQAVKLYGALARTHGAEDMPMRIPSTTTDAATAASVLILSQDLSLFEFNIWHTRITDAANRQQMKAMQGNE